LVQEDGHLRFHGGVIHPTIHPAFADSRTRAAPKQVPEAVLPAFGNRMCLPRVDAIGRHDEIRMTFRELTDVRPIRFPGGIHHAAGDPRVMHRTNDARPVTKPGILKMVVGVDPHMTPERRER